ncbi:MAG: hypothetical protein IPL32_13800 [Chloracidobacterium sp.]|nr:hypothetical protein [Chloracidobacterium sp.]
MQNTRIVISMSLILGVLLVSTTLSVLASQLNIIGPAGSWQFGRQVVALPNGNIAVSDPSFSLNGLTDVGAVYLYDGGTGALISAMTGLNQNDQVGNQGIFVLPSGDFIVASPYWDNGTVYGAGAVTWCSKTTGCPPTISAANSLVGASSGDAVGFKNDPGLTPANIAILNNGNYVVGSYLWDGNGITDAGAATLCQADGSTVGPVSAANSLVGSMYPAYVGNKITALTNGNYVVNGKVNNTTGAVTFGNGTTGITGVVSSANSLVGSGVGIVTALKNGNYVVTSTGWDNGSIQDVGAVTFCNVTTGTVGIVTASNSLVGSRPYDKVGYAGITALSNGNYVVNSYIWDNGVMSNAGAITFGNGTVGVSGAVSSSNSLVGTKTDDQIGSSGLGPDNPGMGVIALANGNYVINSSDWDNGAITDVGAVTFANGTTGLTGTISEANSLVGTVAGESVGFAGVTALTNGNYVVCDSSWTNEVGVTVGAATFGNGTNGVVGHVTSANSLVGSTPGDWVCGYSVTALTNGNYVVGSPYWDNGPIVDAGAVTLGNGISGTTGVVSNANSLVGSSTNDRLGWYTVALANGSYVTINSSWDNGPITDVGAVTFGNGTTGITGPITARNSLLGSASSDVIGNGRVTALSNGNYIVNSPNVWNGAIYRAGAITLGYPFASGILNSSNSVFGTTAYADLTQNSSFDYVHRQLVVGRPRDNIVTFLRLRPNPVSLAVASEEF